MGYQTAANRQRLRELQDGLRANVDALLRRPAADAIADTAEFLASGRAATPQELADIRHRLAAPRKSAQPELNLEPPSCA